MTTLATSDDPRPQFGPWRVLADLGDGEVGPRFSVTHTADGRPGLLLHLPKAGKSGLRHALHTLQAAHIWRELDNPHLADILDADQDDEQAWVVLPPQPPLTLADLEEASFAEVCGILKQAASALGVLHEAGLLARSLRPEDLILSPEGAVQLNFTGLADAAPSSLALNADGALIGSPLYFPPEVGRVRQVDGRADLYVLGLVAYTLLTGRHPFRDLPVMDILSTRAHKALPAPVTREPLPSSMLRILAKLLEVDRDDRYGSARELRADLDAAERGLLISAPPATRWGEAERPGESAPSSRLAAILDRGFLALLVLAIGAAAIAALFDLAR